MPIVLTRIEIGAIEQPLEMIKSIGRSHTQTQTQTQTHKQQGLDHDSRANHTI